MTMKKPIELGIIIFLVLILFFSVLNSERSIEVNSLPFTHEHIDILELNPASRTMKIQMTFYEETQSDDYNERSTNWVLFSQYGPFTGFPIGKADPEWILVGDNNNTIWRWSLQKTFFIEYHQTGLQLYPFEKFTFTFYIVSDVVRFFSVDAMPNYYVEPPERTNLTEEQFTNQTGFSFSDLSEIRKFEITINSDNLAQFIGIGIYLIFAILVILLFTMHFYRDRMDFSNSISIILSVFVFLPLLFFSFRNSIAPNYMTLIDGFVVFLIMAYGSYLIIKIINKHRKKEIDYNFAY